MKYELPASIRVESDGPLRIVQLARPEHLNALNEELHLALTQVWPMLSADTEARAAVITGEGRAFSAGGDMDLLDRMAKNPALRAAVIAEGKDLVLNMIRCRIPVVAAGSSSGSASTWSRCGSPTRAASPPCTRCAWPEATPAGTRC